MSYELANQADEQLLNDLLDDERYEPLKSYDIHIQLFYKYGKRDKNGELKTFTSSKIKELTNFSRTYSSVSIDIVIDFNEDLDEVIKLLDDNLPILKENYPQINRGVASLGSLASVHLGWAA